MWEKVKDQECFYKFADKIVHFVMDDAESSDVSRQVKGGVWDKVMWTMEHTQERVRWTKFLQWNEHHKFFKELDLLGKMYFYNRRD